MKKITLVLLCIVAITTISYAQHSTDTLVRRKKVMIKTFTQKPAQTIYAEAGGNSILWSLNYDSRFNTRLDGLGFRIGAGYFPLGGSNVLVIPFGINIMAGNKGHFVEMALNATIANSSSKNKANPTESKFGQIDFTGNKTNIIYGASMSYRYQQADKKGFSFRAGIEPIVGNRLDNKMVFAVTGHISIGYSF